MKRGKTMVLLVLAIIGAAACEKGYVKAIQKNLQIEHVLSRPTTEYGPGCVVMYEDKSGYTGVCDPGWIIGTEAPKVSPIADVGITKDTVIDFKLDLSAQDKAKIGAEYQHISHLTLMLTNGHQAEIITDLEKAFNEIGTGKCKTNAKTLKLNHPGSKFYFVRVAYAYDFEISIKNENGTKVSGEIPDDVLAVIDAKVGLGFSIKNIYQQKMTGKGLYVGFNGTPVIVSPESIAKGKTAYTTNLDGSVLDITDLLK